MKVILLLLSLGLFVSCESKQPISCFYYVQQEKSFIKSEECISLSSSNDFIATDDSDIYIKKDIINRAYYNEYNLSNLRTDIGIFYFTKKGKSRKVLAFDNSADYFKDGLARTIGKNKKIGYIDTKLNIVIEPKYDFAFPFENKKAIVCNGCTKHKLGEHSSLIGGKWGIIDTDGTLIKPMKYSSFGETYKIILSLD